MLPLVTKMYVHDGANEEILLGRNMYMQINV